MLYAPHHLIYDSVDPHESVPSSEGMLIGSIVLHGSLSRPTHTQTDRQNVSLLPYFRYGRPSLYGGLKTPFFTSDRTERNRNNSPFSILTVCGSDRVSRTMSAIPFMATTRNVYCSPGASPVILTASTPPRGSVSFHRPRSRRQIYRRLFRQRQMNTKAQHKQQLE